MRKELLDGEDIFVIHDFFTPAECADAIARAESSGFDEAPITTAAGPVMARGVRDNARVMIDDAETAVRLFESARPHLPARLRGGWELAGFNERCGYFTTTSQRPGG
jgi:prolyl 4-hydroxylase